MTKPKHMKLDSAGHVKTESNQGMVASLLCFLAKVRWFLGGREVSRYKENNIARIPAEKDFAADVVRFSRGSNQRKNEKKHRRKKNLQSGNAHLDSVEGSSITTKESCAKFEEEGQEAAKQDFSKESARDNYIKRDEDFSVGPVAKVPEEGESAISKPKYKYDCSSTLIEYTKKYVAEIDILMEQKIPESDLVGTMEDRFRIWDLLGRIIRNGHGNDETNKRLKDAEERLYEACKTVANSETIASKYQVTLAEEFIKYILLGDPARFSKEDMAMSLYFVAKFMSYDDGETRIIREHFHTLEAAQEATHSQNTPYVIVSRNDDYLNVVEKGGDTLGKAQIYIHDMLTDSCYDWVRRLYTDGKLE